MKGIIVELRGRQAAVLTDDGRIEKVNNQNYALGQVILMNKETKIKTVRVGIAAAAAAVMVVCGGGAYAYYTPYSYVNLDVNPSIEYSLNRFDRVLQVKGVNDDGEKFVQKVQLKNLGNKKIDEAIAETVRQISEEGFFDGELEGGIVIATSGKDLKKAGELAEQLKESAEEAADADVEVEALAIGQERVEEARALGVSPGKLNLVEKLQASAENPDEIVLEEWLDKPVKEIMKEIKDNRKADKEEAKEEDPQKKQGNGDVSSGADSSEEASPEEKKNGKEDQVQPKADKTGKEDQTPPKGEAKPDNSSKNEGKSDPAEEKLKAEKVEKQNNGKNK